MGNEMVGQEPERGGMFTPAAIGTILIGVGLAALGILHLRKPPAPPPVVVERPPKIEVRREPAPTPRVITRYVRVEPPAPPPPPPRVEKPIAPSIWDGVWRRRKYALPMLQLKQMGSRVTGVYAPDWSGPLPFGDGKVDGDSVEFTVGDPIFRLHVRISMMRTDTATLQVWITDEDWLASLAKANRRVRTRAKVAAVPGDSQAKSEAKKACDDRSFHP